MGIISTLSDLIVDAWQTGKNPPALDTIITNSAIVTSITATAAEINLVADDGQRAVTSTADGLTTGLLTATDNTVVVTSASATNLVTLPAIATVPLGWSVKLFVGANGFDLVTPAASNTTINAVDADNGAAQMAVPASSYTLVTKILATGWIAECYVTAGTRTIPTPA